MLRALTIYTLTFILVYSTITGCQEQPKDNIEIKYTYYKGGAVESESQYVNGVRHGYRKFLDENGKLISITNYVNGKREGALKSYYPDGTLKMTGNFVNDKLSGEVLSFYPGGKLESKKIYENGKMVSNAHYTADGKLDYEDKF